MTTFSSNVLVSPQATTETMQEHLATAESLEREDRTLDGILSQRTATGPGRQADVRRYGAAVGQLQTLSSDGTQDLRSRCRQLSGRRRESVGLAEVLD